MTTSNGNKIMLVEDDSTMQAVLRTLLEIEGFEVTIAPSKLKLNEIIQMVRDTLPDRILLDVHLRETTGFDVLQQLRAEPEISQTRVIMSSGMDVKDRCMAAGADSFIMKPYMPDELIARLRE